MMTFNMLILPAGQSLFTHAEAVGVYGHTLNFCTFHAGFFLEQNLLH